MTDIQIKYWAFREGARHNLVYEQETARHNKETERQTDVNLVEMKRHNIAQEAIGRTQASASMVQAAAAQQQAQTAQYRAEQDKLESISRIAFNEAKTEQTNISNYIEGYGKESKAQLSEINAFSYASNQAAKVPMDVYDTVSSGSRLLSNLIK